MKKYLFGLLCMLFVTGCESGDTVNIDKLDAIAGYEYDSTIICEAFDKEIKFLNFNYGDNWLVTVDNEVYVFDTSVLYSDDSNCKKLDEGFDSIIHVDIDYNWDLHLARYVGDTAYYNFDLEMVSVDTTNYEIERRKTREELEMKADMAAIRVTDYIRYRKTDPTTAFGIKGDNHIYMFSIDSFIDYEYIDKSIIDNEEIVFSVPEDEVILDFYYSTDADINGRNGKDYGKIEQDVWRKYILTDKSYYRPMIVNEDCMKYVDVECDYEWRRDEELSKIRNDILFMDDTYLILSNGRVFYNSYYTP